MAAAIDNPNVVATSYQGASPASPLAVTVAAGDNILVLLVGAWITTGLPSGITYGGAAMTMCASHISGLDGGVTGVSVWFLNNPTVGTANIIISGASNFTALGYVAIPMFGVNLTAPPIAGTGTEANSTTAAASIAGGTLNDVYLATTLTENATIAANGGQTNLATKTAINTNGAWAGDTQAGTGTGNFSWTLTANFWVAIAVRVVGIIASTGGTSGASISKGAGISRGSGISSAGISLLTNL